MQREARTQPKVLASLPRDTILPNLSAFKKVKISGGCEAQGNSSSLIFKLLPFLMNVGIPNCLSQDNSCQRKFEVLQKGVGCWGNQKFSLSLQTTLSEKCRLLCFELTYLRSLIEGG